MKNKPLSQYSIEKAPATHYQVPEKLDKNAPQSIF